jgi:biopolymer transport protein ExbD
MALSMCVFCGCTFSQPPAPVEITTPKTESPGKQDGFLIAVKKDGTIWYKNSFLNDSEALIQVQEPIEKNITTIVLDYNKMQKGPNRFLIQGSNTVNYEQFKRVINGLREAGEFKYNLISPGIDETGDDPNGIPSPRKRKKNSTK